MLIVYILLFLLSFILNMIVINTKIKYIFLDEILGVQKVHKGYIPRIGGLTIFSAFLILCLIFLFINKNIYYLLLVMLSLPAFLGGILEDITKDIHPKERIFFSTLSAVASVYILDISITRLDIPIVDNLLSFYLLSFGFTVFAIVGFINAMNIIDGFNGLASGTALIILISLAIVSYKLGDKFVLSISVGLISIILGFFLINFPFGKIFLGDGGAYFIGFIISVLVIYLVKKHSDVSPWYALNLLIYPVFETTFSIYRRRYVKKLSPMEPDKLHLHMLIYRRIILKLTSPNLKHYLRNSLTTPFLWVLTSIPVALSTIFFKNTFILILVSILFILIYILFYKLIINFKISRGLSNKLKIKQ